jgi:tetratricopeptide (TPR) repeat protein
MFRMQMKRGLSSFLATVVAVGIAATASAQGEMGHIKGSVTDEQGQPLEGAVMKLHNTGKGGNFSLKTDKKGLYFKRSLPSGTYEFTLEKDGYKSVNDTFKVAAGGDHKFDFKLAKGAPEGAKEFAQGFDAFNRGDNAGAAAVFEAALVKAPEMPEIHVNLAIAYLRLDRKADAVKQLEEAVKLAPDQPRIMFQLGGAYVEMKDFDKARTAFEQGLAKQPDLTKDAMALEATVTLGAVYFAKGDLDKSIASFERALVAKPGAPVPMLGLGKAYLSKGDTEKALQEFQKVIAAAPGSSEAKQAEAFVAGLKKPGSPEAGNEERSSA